MYSYDAASESGIALARALDILMIRHENSRFKGSPQKIVLNWGCSDLPREVRKCTVINDEKSVMIAINKLWALQRMSEHDVSTVPWTDDIEQAHRWLAEGSRVVVRSRLKGYDGAGLSIVNPGQELPVARLYTKFIRAEKEYRITCFRSDREDAVGVIGRQRKVVLDNAVNINHDVKTTGGGYGFKWVTLNIPQQVEDCACAAIKALGLDFGGVDVIWDGRQAYVLEVNTAPHLTPVMVTRMREAITRSYGNQ